MTDATPVDWLLRLTGVSKVYPGRTRRNRATRALDDVTCTVRVGETFGIVGASGSGKTTLGRVALRLIEPSAGRVELAPAGTPIDVTALAPGPLRTIRRHAQMVFQDPYTSLDPRLRVCDIVSEPLMVHGLADVEERETRARELLHMVGLPEAYLRLRPEQLSGGERQRVGIARAIATRPRLIVADEPVAALDAAVQGHVLNCLHALQRELALTLVVITHDLAVIDRMADRVGVMEGGRLVEVGSPATVFASPDHAATRRLVAHARL